MPKTKTAPQTNQTNAPAAKQPAHDHDHAGHDHSAHGHEGHDHSGHVHTDELKKNSALADNITFTVTVTWKEVQVGYNKALEKIAQTVQLDGFRKGKAPKALVEEKLGKTKVFEASIDEFLPKAYADEMQKRNIRPIVNPQVRPISLEENKDWVFEFTTAEAPEVKLGDYQDTIKTVKAKTALWTPDKNKKDDKPPTDEDKLRGILAALLDKTKVAVPELVVREEVNRMISRLVQQLDRMKVSLDDYFKSVGKSADEIRQEYALTALASLQIEFIIAAIANAEKIVITDKEVEDVIASLPDENMRKINSTPTQKMNIKAGLIKQKTIDRILAI